VLPISRLSNEIPPRDRSQFKSDPDDAC